MIERYEDLKIGCYRRLIELQRDDDLDDVDRHVEILSVLSDLSADELRNLPMDKFRKMMDRTGFLLEQPQLPKVRKVYEVGGWRLRPSLRMEQFTAGQYIDFQSYAKDPDANMVELLSVFLVPAGKTYGNGYDLYELKETLYKCFPVLDAHAVIAFFLRNCRRYVKSSVYYLETLIRTTRPRTAESMEKIKRAKTKLQELRRSRENGDGMLRYSGCLTLPILLHMRR